MTKDNINDIEIRKLPTGSVFKLCQILECAEGWKQLMSVIPLGCKEGNPPKYTVEHMKLIETAGQCQKRPYSEILLEEWGTSGKCRPTVSILLHCLRKAELYRAADFVAVQLLKELPPPRPSRGPAAQIKFPNPSRREQISEFTPSAPPAPNSNDNQPLQPVSLENLTVSIDQDRVEVVELNYRELEAGTGGWGEAGLLGGGGWGSVYLANLPRLGAVAVKRLHQTPTFIDPQRQFHNEVRVLSKLTHPNLLPLLGYSHDGPALCLAYKYMKHGSLLDRLACKNFKTPLFWKTRLEIGLGTARGIAHLHTALEKPLVHRDVKSANILLDENLVPKLGDFGLVRLGSNGNTTYSSAITTNAVGTSAYMAPEAQRGDVSVKMDVFSFGVVLLELLTSLPPLDKNRDGHDLVTYVGDVKERESLVDNRSGAWPPHLITNMFQLTDACLVLERGERPFISYVIEKLETFLQ